jgi:amino acid permease
MYDQKRGRARVSFENSFDTKQPKLVSALSEMKVYFVCFLLYRVSIKEKQITLQPKNMKDQQNKQRTNWNKQKTNQYNYIKSNRNKP